MIDPRSKVLLCGTGGCGMYLVWRIVSILQRANNTYQSVSVMCGKRDLFDAIRPEGVRKFPEEADVDVMHAGKLEVYWQPHRFLNVDRDLFDGLSSLIWSLDMPSSLDWAKKRTQRLFVVRDARDVVTSLLYKMVSEQHREMNPQYRCNSVDELIELEGYVEKLALHWRSRMRDFLVNPERWFVVRYEDMKGGDVKERAVVSLANHIRMRFDDALLSYVMQETSLATHREWAPNHTSKPGRKGHQELGITERIEAVCGEELERLEYALCATT